MTTKKDQDFTRMLLINIVMNNRCSRKEEGKRSLIILVYLLLLEPLWRPGKISHNIFNLRFQHRKRRNRWVLICELREKCQDPRNLFQLISISAKNIEKNWKILILIGLLMRSWSMWVLNGHTWTRSKNSLSMKWLLRIKHAMTNSY